MAVRENSARTVFSPSHGKVPHGRFSRAFYLFPPAGISRISTYRRVNDERASFRGGIVVDREDKITDERVNGMENAGREPAADARPRSREERTGCTMAAVRLVRALEFTTMREHCCFSPLGKTIFSSRDRSLAILARVLLEKSRPEKSRCLWQDACG